MIVRGPWPSLGPDRAGPAWAFLARSAARLPDKPALVEADDRLTTYGALWDACRRLARWLQRAAGVARGETVAIAAPDGRDHAAALYGALRAGARVTLLHPGARERECAHQLADAEAVVAFASAPVRAAIAAVQAAGGLPRLRRVAAIEDVWALAAEQPATPAAVGVDPHHDLALLPYSSGTTGLPKGVMLTHANVYANVRQRLIAGPHGERSVVFSTVPDFVSRLVFAVGGTLVLPAGYAAADWLAWMAGHGVTDLVVSPATLRALVAALDVAAALPRLRLLFSGNAALPRDLYDAATRRFGCPLVQGYGLTETTGTNRTPLHAPRAGSVGPPHPEVEERIVDPDTLADLPLGAEGELLVRGPQVMQGYWRQPAATAHTLLPGGWLRTGDLGRFAADGYLYVTGRAKDVIKVRGRQVAPAEIEAVLLEHPAVQEAVVVPMPDPTEGEVPRALVVLRPGAACTAAALMALVARRLAPYKLVRAVEFVPALPHGRGGKVLRHALTYPP